MERLSNLMKIQHFLLSVLSAFFIMGTNLDARLFTTVDGKKVYGNLVEANDNFVKIKRQSDGRVFTVGLNRLSKDNRKLVQAYLTKKGKKTKAPSTAPKAPSAMNPA